MAQGNGIQQVYSKGRQATFPRSFLEGYPSKTVRCFHGGMRHHRLDIVFAFSQKSGGNHTDEVRVENVSRRQRTLDQVVERKRKSLRPTARRGPVADASCAEGLGAGLCREHSHAPVDLAVRTALHAPIRP